MEAQGSARSRAQSKAAPPPPPPASNGVSNYLANLPSRGLFSSTVLSSNLGGVRVYVCDHDTAPPEEQVIKTNTMNILIRALQINKHKSDPKDAKASNESNKGKRSAGRALEERTPAKRANTTSSSSSRQEGSTTGFDEKNLQAFTVERLRGLLKERGLSPRGKKDELITRLRDGSIGGGNDHQNDARVGSSRL